MLTRRHFAAAGLASIAFAGLARRAFALAEPGYRDEVPGYGPLTPDPAGRIDLPEGFSYRVVSHAGEKMDDGFFVPDKFDGMGCIPLGGNRVALIRNHELKAGEDKIGPTGGVAQLEARLRSLPHFGKDEEGKPLPGGTTTIVYDMRRGRRERQFLSLAGTAVNCAGGHTPWGSWLSCEEVDSNKVKGPIGKAHGWVFDVPARQRGLVQPVPLKGLGRFRHEAAAIDPGTGIVYLTEDQDDGLVYRFLPNDRRRLGAGGKLQAMGLRDAPGGGDTRNWAAQELKPGSAREVVWIDLDGTDSPEGDLRLRGHKAGAALFARGEGIYAGQREYYFTCTSGGAAKVGQVMRYVPSPSEGQAGEKDKPGQLQLFVESSDPAVISSMDNIAVAPWGHLIACEDRAGDGEVNHIKGITPGGRVYTIGRLRLNTELAGACFSPDGSTLFVNIYAPGWTIAVTGPWKGVKSA